jgi:peptide/nickel transport system substrate-binding protein
MEEPLTDIMQVVGRDGIATEVSAIAEQTLQQLSFSGSWRVSNNLLRRLHRQLTIDLTIIPLFQVKEHYAYRNTVTGVGRGVVHLYQNIERWKIDVYGSMDAE